MNAYENLTGIPIRNREDFLKIRKQCLDIYATMNRESINDSSLDCNTQSNYSYVLNELNTAYLAFVTDLNQKSTNIF